ncbi:MAG: hypothetical protein ACI4WW_07530 [Candidatus Coprovivens sp.]
MNYLIDLGIESETIKYLNESLPTKAIETLETKKDVVTENIKYLKELGVSNITDAFVKFYNMFLLDNETFDEIFSKYDREDLVAKLEKNVAIMEYL